MRAIPCNLEGEGAIAIAPANKNSVLWSTNSTKEGTEEPRSVLDHGSPSPPTSTSTFSSSMRSGGGGGSADISGGVAAVSDNGGGVRKGEWAAGLQPIPASLEKCGLGVDDWESVLCGTLAVGHESPFLSWVVGDSDDPSSVASAVPVNLGNGGDGGFGMIDPFLGFSHLSGSESVASGGGFPPQHGSNINNNGGGTNPNPIFPLHLSFSQPQGMVYQEAMEEKSHIFGPNLLFNNQQQNLYFSPPFSSYAEAEHPLLPLLSKGHHSMADPSCQFSPSVPSSDSGQDFMSRRHQQNHPTSAGGFDAHIYHTKPKTVANEVHDQQQPQALFDQLLKAAELVEAGNSVNACGILARLNHLVSPEGKPPLFRSAFYFKEALYSSIIADNQNTPPSFSLPSQHNRTSALITPMDVILKLGTYKVFSEISPFLQFTNFTCIQAILEELNGCNCIHIVDFDIGVGGQWSSFMQELSQRRCSATSSNTLPSLKITAVVHSSSHHPLELILARETLSQFASNLKIPFELNILTIDSFNPAVLQNMSPVGSEEIAVNIPVGFSHTSTLAFLRLIKQLSPKIVVSVDNGFDRSDLSFSQHFLHALHKCTVLLESIDAAGANPELANKIERFLVQPRIVSTILGRHHSADKLAPWRSLFALSGFIPVLFSNFTETQADCLLKRVQVLMAIYITGDPEEALNHLKRGKEILEVETGGQSCTQARDVIYCKCSCLQTKKKKPRKFGGLNLFFIFFCFWTTPQCWFSPLKSVGEWAAFDDQQREGSKRDVEENAFVMLKPPWGERGVLPQQCRSDAFTIHAGVRSTFYYGLFVQQ